MDNARGEWLAYIYMKHLEQLKLMKLEIMGQNFNPLNIPV